MSSALRKAACAAALAAAVASAGCGQRGPLALPDSAKPIQRLDPNAARPGDSQGSTSNSQARPTTEPDDNTDESERTENER